MKVERSIEIAARPERIYELVMDPDRLGDWVTIHAGLRDAPHGELEKGSELTQCLKLAGQRINVHWKVVRADKPKKVEWDGRGPVSSKARVTYGFEPSGDGTCFTYTNEYNSPGGPLGRIADRVLAGTSARETDRTLERLKKLVERDGA
jgi:carbon monoxide dehydrogenase subunit G